MKSIIKAETTPQLKTKLKRRILTYNVTNERITETYLINLLVDAFIEDPKETIKILTNIKNR